MPYVYFLATLLQAIIFLHPGEAQASSVPAIVINEVQISGGTGHTNDDFIELYNTTDTAIDMSGWQLRKKIKSDITQTGASLKSFSADTNMLINIPAKGYLLWANSSGAFKQVTDTQFSNTSTLTDDNSIALFDANSTLIDAVTWGSGHVNPFAPTLIYPINPIANTSIERNLVSNTFLIQTHPTPQNTSTIATKPTPPPIIIPPAPEPPQSTSIRINEILPDPSDTDEFIELFNFGETDINLKNWSLHDASKTGMYIFKNDMQIKAQSYLTLPRSTFSFALNNSNETITLSDIHNNPISSINYTKSSRDISYNFSPTGWRWSDSITPDALNQFNAPPDAETTIPKNVYRGIPADFTANTAIGSLKYLWDFGDGHTSRLANVTHTYSETGTYTATLTVFNAIEETTKTFIIEVKKLPKTKLSITGINPNPAGADTNHEWITVKNSSKKKVNLLGWSVAVGTDRGTLANHPIRESLILKQGKEATLKNDITAFLLPNKGGLIELRQPDKSVIDTLRYTKTDSIQDDDVYRQYPDKLWRWSQNDTSIIADPTDNSDMQTQDSSTENTENKAHQTSASLTQTKNTASADDIANAIDTLSVDELALLKTRIEKRLGVALATEASETPLPEANDVSGQTSSPTDSDITYHTQSLENTARERVVSIIGTGLPLQKVTARISNDSSLLAKEPVETHVPKNRNADLLHRINQTMNSLLRTF